MKKEYHAEYRRDYRRFKRYVNTVIMWYVDDLVEVYHNKSTDAEKFAAMKEVVGHIIMMREAQQREKLQLLYVAHLKQAYDEHQLVCKGKPDE